MRPAYLLVLTAVAVAAVLHFLPATPGGESASAAPATNRCGTEGEWHPDFPGSSAGLPAKSPGAAAGGPLLGIVALPFLAPLAALVQLLFPGFLVAQWKQYRIAIFTMISLSTAIAIRYFLLWATGSKSWWLSLEAQYAALATIAGIGLVASIIYRPARSVHPAGDGEKPNDADASSATLPARPGRIEFWIFGILFVVGVGWAIWLIGTKESPFDAMFMFTPAAGLALGHLFVRRYSHAGNQPPLVTTETALLLAMSAAGVGLAVWHWLPAGPGNIVAAPVTSEWQSYRGGAQRTGAADPNDPGPAQPQVLWTFDVSQGNTGRAYIHCAPAVVDGQVYFGSMFVSGFETYGVMHCLNAEDGRRLGGTAYRAGAFLWRFPAKYTAKPMYAAPTIVGGRLYFGEGYHQDRGCRLYCVNPGTGEVIWQKTTGSHVESSPWVDGNLVIFGAGDDGVICVDADDLIVAGNAPPSPRTRWTISRVHVDCSPLLVDVPDPARPGQSKGKRVFAGSVVGDIYNDLAIFAWDVEKERLLWRVPTELPACASPSYADGRVFFGFGRGKINEKPANPSGAVWCVNAAADSTRDRLRLWDFPTRSSVFGAAALYGKHVFFCEHDGICYCLTQDDGSLVWKRDLGDQIVASPIVAAGKVYVITRGGRLFGLDAANGGKDLWTPVDLSRYVDDEYGVLSSPKLYRGRIYVGIGTQMICIGDP